MLIDIVDCFPQGFVIGGALHVVCFRVGIASRKIRMCKKIILNLSNGSLASSSSLACTSQQFSSSICFNASL